MLGIAAQPMNNPSTDAFLEHTRIKLDKRLAKSVQLAISAMKVMDQLFRSQKNAPKVTIVLIFPLSSPKIQTS